MNESKDTRIEAAVNRIVSDFAERNIDVHREYFVAILTEHFAPQQPAEPLPNTVFVESCPSTPVPHWCDPIAAEQSEPAKDEERKR